jgi:flagellar basal-body rod protein FlgG
MNGAFYIGATGLEAQQRALDVIGNNIANINTPGFKRSQARFAEMVGQPSGQPGQAASGLDTLGALSGVRSDASPRVFDQGDLKQTGQVMDLAIDGPGFIQLLGPNGQELLWRGGGLKVNADGYLATQDGLPLKAMIAVPASASALGIDSGGRVMALVDGQSGPTEIGRIDLAMVKDSSTLSAIPGGLYQAAAPDDLITVAAGDEGSGSLVQGSIETSNVNLSDEMVSMLLTQRAYGANAQVVQAGDQLMAIANGLKR